MRKQKEIEQVTSKYPTHTRDSTKDALALASKGMVGREKQTKKLKACLTRMLEQPSKNDNSGKPAIKEFVLFSGPDGSGKAKVARTLSADVSLLENGLFVEGKFDMTTSSEPLSGIAKCFGELCQKVMESAPEVICEIQAELNKQLGNEADMLVQLVPELKNLISDTFGASEKIDVGADDEIDNRLEQMRFAFRVLTRVFSAAFFPLVLYFDNLHWADIASLQVLDFLIADIQNENALMIIGCYRSGDEDQYSRLHHTINSIRQKAETYKFNMTEILIEPFGKSEIEQMIRNIMPGPSTADIADLAALCHKRTHGNPFFAIEFLKMLHKEGLVLYKTSSQTWSWDLEQIENATMSTANVAMMLQDRITKLPQQEQTLLQCAAYLGSKFSEPMIDIVWATYGRRLVETRIEPSASLLDKVVKEDILEKVGCNQYRWVHDKLQEAALQLSEARRESFQLDIGRTLYYGLEKKQVEEELFAIVDLINNGNVLKLPEFAHANLRAAEKARDLSAFQSAAQYAAHGVSLLKDDKWTSNRSLTLGLFVMGAEMELMMGNVAEASRYSDEVLVQSEFSAMDTFRIEMARANALGSVHLKFDESLTCYLELLRKLGHRVTWSRRMVPVQAVVKLVRTIKRAKSKPMSFYETMVPIEDPKQKAIVSVFSKLVYTTMVSGDIALHLLCVSVLVEMTLDHGINEFSAKCFASLGNAVVIAQQDHKTAGHFIDIALSMLKKFRGMHASETSFIAYMALSWVTPIEDCMTHMLESVPEGLRSGSMEFAIWNIFSTVLAFPYVLGKPLASILKDCSSVFVQCEDAAQAAHSGATKIAWQMLHNLSSSSCQNPSELEGDIFSAANHNETDMIHESFTIFAQGELSFFFLDYETTAKRALEIGDKYEKKVPNYPLIVNESFHRAVALHAAALRTKKRRYRVEARRLARRFSRWAENGNPNVRYQNLFLQAEQLALHHKPDMAEEKYENALEAVAEEGHLQHLGLINERYAEFLARRGLETQSSLRLKEAIRYYNKWGAVQKAKTLEDLL